MSTFSVSLRYQAFTSRARILCLFLNFYNFIYSFLAAVGFCWFARAFSSCGNQGLLSSCHAFASPWGGFSYCRAPGSRHEVAAQRLGSWGSRAKLLQGMWNLPGPGIKPVSPALAGGFFTTEPPGKPFIYLVLKILLEYR